MPAGRNRKGTNGRNAIQGRAQQDQSSARDSSPADEDEPEWACSACSFVNSGLLAYCEICEFAKRGATSSSTREPTEHPNACTLCSYHNPVGRTACEVCEAPLAPHKARKPDLARAADSVFDRGGQGATPKGFTAAVDDEEFMTPPTSPPTMGGSASAKREWALRVGPLAMQPAVEDHSPDLHDMPPDRIPIGSKAISTGPPRGVQARKTPDVVADEEERRLLLSMGWDPDDLEGEGGLEEWEIDAAQESFIEHLQREPHEGLPERARREFEEWRDKAAQTLPPPATAASDTQVRAVASSSGSNSGSSRRSQGRSAPSCGRKPLGKQHSNAD